MLGLGLVIIYVVLAHDGGRPFSNFLFPLLVTLALLDVVGGAVLRSRSPRAFHLDGDQLTIEWAGDGLSVSLDEVHRRRFLSLFLNSGCVFTASGRPSLYSRAWMTMRSFVPRCARRVISAGGTKLTK